MKELDTAMTTYLQHHYSLADPDEKLLFQQLLEEQDPLIMGLLNEPDPASPYHVLIRKIRDTLIADA
jgi:succinate dehydrogenase flavin-adding protein (antitoxin of CptAB toxin-antitoxin module)